MADQELTRQIKDIHQQSRQTYGSPLNPGKWRTLVALTQAYARQKDIFLEAFGPIGSGHRRW